MRHAVPVPERPPSPREWFRNETWDAAIAAEFEARLRRARSYSRAQYVAIQATHLLSSPDFRTREVARGLLCRVIDEYGDELTSKLAWEQLGESLVREGDVTGGEEALRRVIALCAASDIGDSGTSGTAPLQLAELLIARGDASSMTEAERVLCDYESTVEDMSIMRDVVYRYCLARARVSAARGHQSTAEWAAAALRVADEKKPSIPRHPTIGRPRTSDSETAELRRLTRSQTAR